MGFALGTIKLIVFSFNFLLVCIGFGVVLFGILDTSATSELSHIKDLIQDISLLSRILIVAGAVVFLIAFFGCWGTVTESSCMLFMYAIFLICLILMETAVAVYSYVHQDTVKENVSKALSKLVNEYKSSNATRITVNKIQLKLKCCGINSYDDWIMRIPSLPPSCCGDSGQEETDCTANKAYKTGCLSEGMNWLKEKLKKYLWIIGAVLGVEVLTIFFSLLIYNAIKNEERRNGVYA